MKNISKNFLAFINKNPNFGRQTSKSLLRFVPKITSTAKTRAINVAKEIGNNTAWAAGVLAGGSLLYPFFTQREF